jgi:hypothetical protein
MSFDFNLGKYTQLCETIRRLPHEVMTVQQFLQAGQPKACTIILRHDVDRSLRCAVRMAELEQAQGLRSTYYLRTTPAVFHPREIEHLSQLGHEVGYHYEVLSKAKGNLREAVALFENDLGRFRRVVHVDTISAHGSPLTPWINTDIWKRHNYRDFGLLGDVSITIDYSKVYYLTDTGRSWDATRYNVRDRVASRSLPARVHSTDDLIRFLSEVCDAPVILNAHPNRWRDGWFGWGISLVSDWVINQGKVIVHLAGRRG